VAEDADDRAAQLVLALVLEVVLDLLQSPRLCPLLQEPHLPRERDFVMDNLLVQIFHVTPILRPDSLQRESSFSTAYWSESSSSSK
jgi:hypothetical protein